MINLVDSEKERICRLINFKNFSYSDCVLIEHLIINLKLKKYMVMVDDILEYQVGDLIDEKLNLRGYYGK